MWAPWVPHLGEWVSEQKERRIPHRGSRWTEWQDSRAIDDAVIAVSRSRLGLWMTFSVGSGGQGWLLPHFF